MSAGISMIEKASEFRASAAMPLTSGDSTHLTAGAMLRQAREAHNLNLEDVAAALKVPPQKLEALEADDIDALPDPVFARALAASVCRALRVDPAPVLAKLPGALRDGLAQADRTMSGNIRNQAARHPRGSRPLSKPLLVMVGLLLVGAAVLYLLPQSVFDSIGTGLGSLTTRDASGVAGVPAGEPATAPATAPGTVIEPVATGAASPPPAPIGAAGATADATAPAAGGDLLRVATRGDAWITVTEAGGGKVLLNRTVRAGETVTLSGNVPLSVVVARAAGVDVQVRGKAIDLVPFTKSGGIARFQVN